MQDYISNALQTESTNFEEIAQRLSEPKNIRLLHAALGLATEASEIQDMLKKAFFYGKKVDEINLIEECGDIFWYLAILCDALGVNFEEVQQKNIEKLKARYGEKFSSQKAIERNLSKERKILEK